MQRWNIRPVPLVFDGRIECLLLSRANFFASLARQVLGLFSTNEPFGHFNVEKAQSEPNHEVSENTKEKHISKSGN
jgi:hypothetical protein